MGFVIDESLVRQAWQGGAALALDELRATARDLGAAGGAGLGDLQACLQAAASDLAGVTTTATSVLTELHENVEACLATYRASDQKSAGTFHALLASR